MYTEACHLHTLLACSLWEVHPRHIIDVHKKKKTGQVPSPSGSPEITGRMQFSHESTMGDRVKSLL